MGALLCSCASSREGLVLILLIVVGESSGHGAL